MGLLASCLTAFSQNLLTNNPGFEANTAYYTPAWGWPQGAPNALPGWLISLDPYGDGYAGAAVSPSIVDLEGSRFGYLYSGYGLVSGALQTAPESRASIEPGRAYTLWFRARGDASWGAAQAEFSLVWHPNANNDATAGTPAVLALLLPPRQSTSDPVIEYHLSAVAPPDAHYAGARITTPAGAYEPVIFDDFVLMAEPDPIGLTIHSQPDKVVVSWPRSARTRLEEVGSLGATNDWQRSQKPVKGIGSSNQVDCPLYEGPRFFRLSPLN